MTKAESIEIVKDAVRKHTPVVAEFFDREDKILDYSKSLYDFPVDPVHKQRQAKLLKSLSSYGERLFGLSLEPKQPLALNVVDHHAILNHPILLATNIVANADSLLTPNALPIVTFSCSIIPQDNFLSKGGFFYAGKRVSLFSKKTIHQISCFMDSYDFSFVDRQKLIGNWDQFTPPEQDFLSRIEKEIKGLNFSNAKNYNDQISLINNYLWKQLFAEDMRSTVPDLYYYPEVEMIKDCLEELLAENTIISRTLFNPEFREKALLAFDGLIGSWDLKRGKGTHFFWYRDHKNEIKSLHHKNGVLYSSDGSYSVKLAPDDLVEAIKEQKIVPNLFVTYGLLVFWMGVKPLVGYGSANYLTGMKEAWLKVLNDNDPSEVTRVNAVNTKGLVGGEIVTYSRDEKGNIINQYAFDIISNGGLTKEYLNRIFAMRYSDALGPALLDIYNSYVPNEERQTLDLEASDFMGNNFNWL